MLQVVEVAVRDVRILRYHVGRAVVHRCEVQREWPSHDGGLVKVYV